MSASVFPFGGQHTSAVMDLSVTFLYVCCQSEYYTYLLMFYVLSVSRV